MSEIPESNESVEEKDPNQITQRLEFTKGTLLWLVVALTMILMIVVVAFVLFLNQKKKSEREMRLEEQRKQYQINWKK